MESSSDEEKVVMRRYAENFQRVPICLNDVFTGWVEFVRYIEAEPPSPYAMLVAEYHEHCDRLDIVIKIALRKALSAEMQAEFSRVHAETW